MTTVYYKFTPCCGGPDIFFSGLVAIVSGSVYKYVGTTPFLGTGGSLQPGYCYTVVQLISIPPVSYPVAPNIIFLVETDELLDCDDPICTPCTIPVVCECPPGFTEVAGECIQLIEVEAEYTGGLLTVLSVIMLVVIHFLVLDFIQILVLATVSINWNRLLLILIFCKR